MKTMPELKAKKKHFIAALIVAGGRGSRAATANDSSPKQYRLIGGGPVICRTLRVFRDHPAIDQTVAVIHADDGAAYDAATTSDPVDGVVTGGASRQQSVLRGLDFLDDAAPRPDIVLIHDAVRPFVGADVIDRVLAALADRPGAIAALPAVDTLKSEGENGSIAATIPRTGIWGAQTPQGFAFDAILDAHRRAAAEDRSDFTDDAAVAEWAGIDVALVEGSPANVKLTTTEDLAEADRRLTTERMTALGDVRVGSGYDVHAFCDGRSVTLGGIAIDHDRALRGHSDADVALHAVTDALFGALADGDIGSHFPPSDPAWKGAASAVFLQKAVTGVAERGGVIAHIDLTIVCEAPKIGPHREQIRERLARLCGVRPDRVSVKATTSEKLGFTGRREGIAAMATATIRLPFED